MIFLTNYEHINHNCIITFDSHWKRRWLANTRAQWVKIDKLENLESGIPVEFRWNFSESVFLSIWSNWRVLEELFLYCLFVYNFHYFIVACYLWQRFVIILLIVQGSCLILPVNEQTSRLSRVDCLMFQLCQTCLLLVTVYKQVKERFVKIE